MSERLVDLEQPPHPKWLGSIIKGILIGLLGVVAILVWAVNIELALKPGKEAALWGKMLRVILCDLVPFATLIGLYKGLGQNSSMEDTLKGVFAHTVGKRSGPRQPTDRGAGQFGSTGHTGHF